MISKWDKRFLTLAKTVSEWSKDPSTKVGAVIADDNEIISLGFNGFPQSMKDSALLYGQREKKYERIIHAEMNALMRAGLKADGYLTLYTWPLPPCSRCMVHIGQSNILRIVAPTLSPQYAERWGNDIEKSLNFAKEMNIGVVLTGED